MSRSRQLVASKLVILAVAGIMVTTILPLPTAGAGVNPDGSVIICGTIRNKPGWAISEATVLYDDQTDPNNGGEGRYISAGTDGYWEKNFSFAAHDSLTFTITTTVRTPSTPQVGAADGATYVPYRSASVVPANLPPTMCNGVPGVRLPDDASVNNGVITLEAPGQGFIEAQVLDGVLVGEAPLTSAVVGATPVPYVGTGTTSVTPMTAVNDTGIARLVCVDPGIGSNAYIRYHAPNYLDYLQQVTCSAAGTKVTTRMWRTPIEVTFKFDTPSTPTVHASVIKQPSTMRTLANIGNVTACGGSFPGTDQAYVGANAPVWLDNRSPYVCSADANALGTATLHVPWSDSGAFRFLFTQAGRAPQVMDTTLTSANITTRQPLVPNDAPIFAAAPQSNYYAHVQMNPVGPASGTTNTIFRATTRDNAGQNVTGSNITFRSGPSKVTAYSDANGTFAVPLVAGTYDLIVAADAYNLRYCQVTMTAGATPDGTQSLTPSDDCFKLVTFGNGVVSGVLKDDTTGRVIPSINVCWSPPASCVTTNATGAFQADIPAGADWSVGVASDWQAITMQKLDINELRKNVEARLARTTRVFAVTLTDPLNTDDAAGDKIQVCVNNACDPSKVTGPTATDTTIPHGFFKTGELAWNWRPAADSVADTFATPAYGINFERDVANPHIHDNLTLNISTLDPLTIVATRPVAHDGTFNATFVAIDQTSNATLSPATITITRLSASGSELAAANENACTATAASCPTAPASNTVTLWNRSNYVVCATNGTTSSSIDDYIVCTTTGYVKAPVIHTNVTTIPMFRTAVTLTVPIVDAHTGSPVGGATVSAMANGSLNWTCSPAGAPASTYACSSTSGTLKVPFATKNESCVVVAPGSYLETDKTTGQGDERPSFQAAQACGAINSGSKPTVTVVRAASHINGTITDASTNAILGTARVGALPARNATSSLQLLGAPVRKFDCNPPSLNFTPFPDCVNGVNANTTTGRYDLTLPDGQVTTQNEDTFWSLNFSAPGYYGENITRVTTATRLNISLLPKLFNVTVRVQDVPSAAPLSLTSCATAPNGAPVGVNITLSDLLDPRHPSPYNGTGVLTANSCIVTVTGVGWWRPDVASNANGQSPITSSTFLVQVTLDDGRQSVSVQSLGPKATAMTAIVSPPAAFTITGVITDANSTTPQAGVAGATVTASLSNATAKCADGKRSYSTTTVSGGAYVLVVGCSGVYTVSPTSPPLFSAPAYKNADPLLVNAPGIASFTLFRNTSDLVVTVKNLGAAYGNLTNTTVTVTAVDTTTQPLNRTMNDSSGTLTFPALPWGLYTINVQGPSGTQGLPTAALVQPGADNKADAYVLSPPPASEATDYIFIGQVTDGNLNRAGMAGVKIHIDIHGECLSVPLDTQTDVTGTYRAVISPKCPAGNYLISATAPGDKLLYEPNILQATAMLDGAGHTNAPNFTFTRTVTTLTIKVVNASAPATTPGPTKIHLHGEWFVPGIGVATNTTDVTSASDGTVTFVGIPWGLYRMEITAPAGSGPITNSQRAFAMPGAASMARENALIYDCSSAMMCPLSGTSPALTYEHPSRYRENV